MTSRPQTAQQRLQLIAILGAIAAIGPLSIDMYLPGFPTIAEDLNTSISLVNWSLTAYFLGISVGQFIYGPLLDRYGRKNPLLIGFAIYTLAAVGCALAPGINALIAFRLLLALGGCVGMVAARAIIRDSFESNEVARAFSSLILVMGVAPILAPSLGGVVIEYLDWRAIFWILTLYSALLFLLIYTSLPETHSPDTTVSLRFKKVGRSYYQVLQNTQFLIYAVAGSVGMAALFTYISGAPFVFMEIMGYGESVFGWLFGANALFFVVGSQVNRALLRKFEILPLTRISSVVATAAMLFLGFQVSQGIPSNTTFLLNLFSFTFFLGLINPNLQALALDPFRKSAGRASALMGSMRMLAGAMSSGLVGLLHNGTAWPMVGIMAGSIGIVTLIMWSSASGNSLYPQTESSSSSS